MGKFIVTGGAGFIGSFLTDTLIENGHKVVVIDNFSYGKYIHPKATIIDASIFEIQKIKPYFKGIDGCFHLIAIPSVIMNTKDWFHLHDINLRSSLIVFKLAIEAANIPVVYASSCVVYGECSELPLRENQYIKPVSSYGCDKLAVEMNAYSAARNYQLPNIGLRFFNVYGPRQDPKSLYSGVISKFIDRLKGDEAPVIYGDGQQTRDFIFVKDIAYNLIKAMDKVSTKAEVINLCTGTSITINALATELNTLMHKTTQPIYAAPRTYDIAHSVGSIEKMKAYGFDLQYDLSTGLKETIDYFL